MKKGHKIAIIFWALVVGWVGFAVVNQFLIYLKEPSGLTGNTEEKPGGDQSDLAVSADLAKQGKLIIEGANIPPGTIVEGQNSEQARKAYYDDLKRIRNEARKLLDNRYSTFPTDSGSNGNGVSVQQLDKSNPSEIQTPNPSDTKPKP